MCLIIDKKSDYHRACKGFSINGVPYKRLLGTNGGIKASTIVFVSERLADELKRRIENDRDPNKELVTAKLEAYKALTCSASVPVSMPRGIAVINDCETTFLSDITYLTDENDGEPEMEFRPQQEINLDASDGCGMMLPSLAARWSEELGLDYMMSGCNTRYSFEKGMVFTFDFVDFAEKVAGGNYIIKDAWGNDVDVREVELILTTSMVKLWDSYESCDDYVEKSTKNGYTFGVPKTCPEELENTRGLNYQYIQSFQLSDNDIDELIAPTMNEIKDVIAGDWKKTVLFLRGSGMSENNVLRSEDDIAKAIMADPKVLDDPYVHSYVYRLIKNRINEAKVGVINVHGNYSIVSGDPYALCQSAWGLEVTGILKSGEIYNKYWANCESDNLVCFRAPMTCHANIRAVVPVRSEEALYWYRYMKTCTIFNAWDTACAALNGCDFDGDLCMLTDNPVLLRKHKPLPALMCAQRKAKKKVSSEVDFIQSNIDSFGNDIGRTTNYITSMFEVRSHFGVDSEEYKALSYRIQCGQLYQQNAIDKAKGIVCKPMPRSWYDWHTIHKIEDVEKRNFYHSIMADKKPYFMCYIYPALMKEYKDHFKITNRNSLRNFNLTLDELLAIPKSELTDEQALFIKYYYKGTCVGLGDCVMNRICRKFENEFDGCVGRLSESSDFDYTIMKSGVEYSAATYYSIKKIYDRYSQDLTSYVRFAGTERLDADESAAGVAALRDEFKRSCDEVCPDEKVLTDILLDMCYNKSSTKKFVWSMCKEGIIQNLLEKSHKLSFPELSADGDIEYCGNRYVLKEVEVI